MKRPFAVATMCLALVGCGTLPFLSPENTMRRLSKQDQQNEQNQRIAQAKIEQKNRDAALRCASIADKTVQDICHDAYALSDTGEWSIRAHVDPVDDSNSLHLYLKASSNWDIGLRLVCNSDNTTYLILDWDKRLLTWANGRVDMLTRIGAAPAKTENWSISTDGRTAFHRQPILFIKEIMQADKLVVRTASWDGSHITAIFKTSGLVNVVKPLRAACGW